MDTFQLYDDIEIFCVTASSFPDGVKEAHETIHSKLEPPPGRNYFGISWFGEKGKIVYKAAVTEKKEGDLEQFNWEKRMIPAGEYYYKDINDFMSNIPAIGQAFEELGNLAPINEDSMAIEWYTGMNEVRCMVRKS